MKDVTKTAQLIKLEGLPGVECPCGIARRAFADRDDLKATVHLTEITTDARVHYHATHTEVYVVLQCEDDAKIELDGQEHPISPLTAVLIPPRVRHRAVGKMKVIIFCSPGFDPADEHFD